MRKIAKKYLFFIVLFTFLIVNSTILAYPDYQFKHYNINNGLSQNTVFCIFQDNQGFMWFGTKDGLNRFDGTSFKTFRFLPNGELRDNVFKRILQVENHDLWVATDEGVYIYNPRQESFRRFDKQTEKQKSITGTVSDMIMDDDGDIWISVEEEGVFHYNVSQSQLTFYEVPLSDEMKILTLCAGKNNDVWVFPYSRPFLHIDKRSKKVSEFQLRDEPTLLSNVGEVSSVLADQYNELILATSQKGLLSVNTVNRTHKVLLDKDQSGELIFGRSIIRTDNKTLWIGTESGIYILNTETNAVRNLRNNNSVPYSLSDNAIYSIYKDNDDGIWIGTYFSGVNYYPNQLSGFDLFYKIDNFNSLSGNRVREFCPGENGKIWIGTEDKGLNLFDPVSSTFLPVDNQLKNLYTNIHALYNDGRYLWISTFSKGLNRYDFKTHKLITYTQFDEPETISQNSAFALCRDRQNMLWIGTLSGVNIYDYDQDSFRRVKEMEGISIQDIMEDTDGTIWIATFQKGLYRYNPLTRQWRIFLHDSANENSLPYNKTTAIFEDSKKRLWIATQGGGFSLFNDKEETFSTFNSSNGLINNVVYQIQEDNEGYLWLSTNSGLVRFSPETNSFRNYSIDNGLKTNQFNYKSSFKAEDGTLYFGSVEGFVRFHPSHFKEIDTTSPVVFTDFQINNYPANVSAENSPLTESIQYTKNIILPYNKNSIGFTYAVLNYIGLNTKYVVHKLEGFDENWMQSNANKSMLYTNLPAGKYRLQMAYENENNPDQKEIINTINIHIKPPFWRAWWAYLIYLMLFASIIWGAFFFSHLRSEKIQARKMRIFQQEKERELYESKIDFFTNVAHEIRTPLSLIKAPLDQILQENNLSNDIAENLVIIDKNTDRLLNLANQLLDFRKTESDLYTLNMKVYNISNLIEETFSRFTPFAKQNNVAFSLDSLDDNLLAKIDKEAFIKIISNLLNNAIKYAASFVRITVDKVTQHDISSFRFSTINDGAVVPEGHKKEIFKSFVQINDNQNKIVNGTGLGLALAKSLTELLKGSLSYSNKDGLNVFNLVLPIGAIEEENEISLHQSINTYSQNDDFKNTKNELPVALLVEDDVEMGDFLSKCLKKNHSTLRAFNGKEALDLLRNNTVNIIVSDVMMPEMDGLELTEIVKSNLEFSHIPVILLTAKANVQSKVEGLETGADAYIEKPFSIDVLEAQIDNLLKNRDRLREIFINYPHLGLHTNELSKSDQDFIQKLSSIVVENLSNSDFNVEDIADEFNMSRASFYRKIKGVLDLTPNEYIRVERLKKAAQLLKERNYKVNEICYMVGFNSPSYFSKCFQQQFGVLPKDFL